MFCEKCGSALLDGAKFCGNCGAIAEPSKPAYTGSAQYSAPPPDNSGSGQYSPPPPPYSPPQQTYYPPQQNYPAPSNTEPLRIGQYIGMFILSAIPIVNIIMLFVWGFGSSGNLNKKNYARAALILIAIGIVLSIIFSITLAGFIRSLFGFGRYYYY